MSSEKLLLQRIVSGDVGQTGLVAPLGASLHTHRYPKDFQPTRSDVFFTSRFILERVILVPREKDSHEKRL